MQKIKHFLKLYWTSVTPVNTPSLLKKFKSIEKRRGIYSDAFYCNAVFTLLCKFFVDDETVIKSNSKFSMLKKYCSCTNLKMSRIYGAATGDPRLSMHCTPSTVAREARKCAKIGEKLLVITASFNGIKIDNAHSRLVIIPRYLISYDGVWSFGTPRSKPWQYRKNHCQKVEYQICWYSQWNAETWWKNLRYKQP